MIVIILGSSYIPSIPLLQGGGSSKGIPSEPTEQCRDSLPGNVWTLWQLPRTQRIKPGVTPGEKLAGDRTNLHQHGLGFRVARGWHTKGQSIYQPSSNDRIHVCNKMLRQKFLSSSPNNPAEELNQNALQQLDPDFLATA